MEINILLGDQSYVFNVNSTDSVKSVKDQIRNNISLPSSALILVFNKIVLLDDKKLSDYNIRENDFLNLGFSQVGFSRDE